MTEKNEMNEKNDHQLFSLPQMNFPKTKIRLSEFSSVFCHCFQLLLFLSIYNKFHSRFVVVDIVDIEVVVVVVDIVDIELVVVVFVVVFVLNFIFILIIFLEFCCFSWSNIERSWRSFLNEK